MRASNIISQKEHYAYLVFSFLIATLIALIITTDLIISYNGLVEQSQKILQSNAGDQKVILFSGHGYYFTVGGFNLITFFIFLSLIRPRRYIASTFFIFSYAAMYTYAIHSRLDGEGAYGGKDFFTDKWYELYIKTDLFDYMIAVIIITFITWQLSIIWRICRHRVFMPVLP